MNYKARTLILIAVSLCGSIGAWAQARTTDNLLFTFPPTPVAAVSPNVPASGGPASPHPPQPVVFTFDHLPGKNWRAYDCLGSGSGTVLHGILTINSHSDCYEYILYDPLGVWNQFVSNSRGWVVEASLKVDPITDPACGGDPGSVLIWANDHTNLLILGFSTNEICLAYPEFVDFPMNTTDSFHVYRIEAKGTQVRVYVDGVLAIDHTLTVLGSGTQALVFGDGTVFGNSLTNWDYFSYNVFPTNLAP